MKRYLCELQASSNLLATYRFLTTLSRVTQLPLNSEERECDPFGVLVRESHLELDVMGAGLPDDFTFNMKRAWIPT